MNNNDSESEDESVEGLADTTARDWVDAAGRFLYDLGVAAMGFGLVALVAAIVTKWIVIPVLRARGWCV